eukprot:Awhi_evm1s13467
MGNDFYKFSRASQKNTVPQEVKVVLLGEQCSGKTSLWMRFVTSSFVEVIEEDDNLLWLAGRPKHFCVNEDCRTGRDDSTDTINAKPKGVKDSEMFYTLSFIDFCDQASRAKGKSLKDQFRDYVLENLPVKTVFLFCFDITTNISVSSVREWHDFLCKHYKRKIPCVVVATKADVEDKIQSGKLHADENADVSGFERDFSSGDGNNFNKVKKMVGKELATEFDCPFVLTSAKTGENVDVVFERAIKQLQQMKF